MGDVLPGDGPSKSCKARLQSSSFSWNKNHVTEALFPIIYMQRLQIQVNQFVLYWHWQSMQWSQALSRFTAAGRQYFSYGWWTLNQGPDTLYKRPIQIVISWTAPLCCSRHEKTNRFEIPNIHKIRTVSRCPTSMNKCKQRSRRQK